MSKIFNKITAFLVFGFMCFILVTSFLTGDKLTEFPEFSIESFMDGSFGKNIESYFKNNFTFHDLWNTEGSKLESNICESIVNGVYISEDMLLDTEFSEKSFDVDNAEQVNIFTGNYDGAVYFTAVPDSSGVYGDILPEYIVSSTEKQRIDSFYEQLGSNIRKIDAYNILRTVKDNYIYYRSDNRWTSYGAYCVYRTVIQKLGFLPSAYDKYTIEHVTDNYKGNLYSRSNYMKSKADILDIYEYSNGSEIIDCIGYNEDGTSGDCLVYDKSAINTDNMYNLYMNGEYPLVILKTSLANERKLLIIKDSFADCFIPFLIQHYSEIAIVSPEYMQSGISNLIDKNDYEQTLFLLGIDNLNNNGFFSVINN